MNAVTVLLLLLFILPVLAGILNPFSGSFRHSLLSALGKLELSAGLLLSLWLTRLVFSHPENGLLTKLYGVIPPLRQAVYEQDIWVVLLVLSLLLFLVPAVLGLLTAPLRRGLSALADRLSAGAASTRKGMKRLAGGLWRLPTSLLLVTGFALLLNFYAGYGKNALLGEYIRASSAYRMVDETVLEPVLGSGLVQKVPAFLSDSLEKAAEDTSLDKLHGLIYVNGVSLDDAVRSNDEIDRKAKEIVGKETEARNQAYLLYEWICGHITYDTEKAEALGADFTGLSSGAAAAFSSGRGVCFDYACLYVSMCRAVGLDVRLLAGSAYDGAAWREHSWNQVYLPDEDGWLSVDATFGSAGGRYFGNPDFYADHSGGTVLGEWK